MKIYSLHIILFTILLLNNCKKEVNTYNFDENYLESIKKSQPYSSHVSLLELKKDENLEYSLPLITIGSQSSDRNYIFGDIKKVKVFDSKVFLLDSRSKELKIFKLNNGAHINTFQLSGRGPGELLQPVDMLIDEDGGTLFLLDNQRKLLAYNVNNPEPELSNEIILDYIPESFCANNSHIIIRSRLGPAGVSENLKGNIIPHSKFDLTPGKTFGNVFTSNNWLLTDQLSRGTIYCSENNDIVYSVDRYLPHIKIYSKNNSEYKSTDRVLLDGLELIQIVPSFNENQPVISYKSSDSGKRAVMDNVISNKNYIFIQTYELNRTGEEVVTTYQISKNDYSLVKAFDHIGTIHEMNDSLLVTSKNFPYPMVEIFSTDNL